MNIRGPQVLRFLRHLARHVRGPFVLVWDRGRSHKHALVRDCNARGGISTAEGGIQQDVGIVHNTVAGIGGVGIAVDTWSLAGSAGNVLAFNAVAPPAKTAAISPRNPTGTVVRNIVCHSTQACCDKEFMPAGQLVDAAGTGTEPWPPTDDFADTPRAGPADVGGARTREVTLDRGVPSEG